jgi:hypothetical protein
MNWRIFLNAKNKKYSIPVLAIKLERLFLASSFVETSEADEGLCKGLSAKAFLLKNPFGLNLKS